VFKQKGRGYDQTGHYALNYKHPICSKWTSASVQNEQMELLKMNKCTNTYPNQIKQQRPTASRSTSKTFKNSSSPKKEPSYREDFKEAGEWLESRSPDFQLQVREYIDYNVNSPKTRFPNALRMKIVVEIWKKYNDRTTCTDFEYINKEDIKPSKVPVIQYDPILRGDEGLEEEMQKLYLGGNHE
jgi:hypothetical protein